MLYSSHGPVRPPQPALATRHVHRRRAPRLYRAGSHRAGEGVADPLQLLWRRRGDKPDPSGDGNNDSRLHLVVGILVLLHRSGVMPNMLEGNDVLDELVCLHFPQCWLHDSNHQHRPGI